MMDIASRNAEARENAGTHAGAIIAFAILSWLKSQVTIGLFPLLALAVSYGTTIISLLFVASGRHCLNEAVKIMAKIADVSKRAFVNRRPRNHAATSG